jgi:hypothetical protein
MWGSRRAAVKESTPPAPVQSSFVREGVRDELEDGLFGGKQNPVDTNDARC